MGRAPEIMGSKVLAFTSGTTLTTACPPRSTIPATMVLPAAPRPRFPRSFAPDVGLVNLDLAKEGDTVLGHELADLLEHPPGRLVGDADLPFKLLCRYARPGGSHEEHGVKPGAKRSRGLVEDGICRGGYLGAAELAAIDLSALDAVVGSDLLAGKAGDAIGPAGRL